MKSLVVGEGSGSQPYQMRLTSPATLELTGRKCMQQDKLCSVERGVCPIHSP